MPAPDTLPDHLPDHLPDQLTLPDQLFYPTRSTFLPYPTTKSSACTVPVCFLMCFLWLGVGQFVVTVQFRINGSACIFSYHEMFRKDNRTSGHGPKKPFVTQEKKKRERERERAHRGKLKDLLMYNCTER